MGGTVQTPSTPVLFKFYGVTYLYEDGEVAPALRPRSVSVHSRSERTADAADEQVGGDEAQKERTPGAGAGPAAQGQPQTPVSQYANQENARVQDY